MAVNNSRKNILIIGDWVLDEHWITGVHRSPTSARTGMAHHRTLHTSTSTTKSLCAAGRVASLLHQARCDGIPIYNIFGVGWWHLKDTDCLNSWLDPANLSSNIPGRITLSEGKKNKRAQLYNLAELFCLNQEENGHLDSDQMFWTTTIYRFYEQKGANVELFQRIDWEKKVPEIEYTDEILAKSNLAKCIENVKFDAVVINDICKGVVKDDLIEWLCNQENTQAAKWFISTKDWGPSWLDVIIGKSEIDIKLLLVHQVAAQSAVRNGELPTWITKSGKVTIEAMDEIVKKSRLVSGEPLLITMPKGLQIVACDFSASDEMNQKKPRGYLQKLPYPITLPAEVPTASVFFPAVASLMVNFKDISTEALLKKALDFSQKWMKCEGARVEKPETWTAKSEPRIQYTLLNKPNADTDEYSHDYGQWDIFNWKDEINQWNAATVDIGIVTVNGPKGDELHRRLELWRSMVEVNGYVCCGRNKRMALRKISRHLQAFEGQRQKRHTSCMLIARPGSGKTFLVDRLAAQSNMRVLTFNITQMLSKNDILDCFDTIATTQAQNKNKSLIVFFDEINAKIEMQHVYDIFLSPIDQGKYIRAGKTFHLDPCFWFFAGTEHPKNDSDSKMDKSQKASDIISRLSIPPIQWTIDMGSARVEKVYLGVSIIGAIYSDVRKVSEKVLRTFHNLHPSLEVRDLKHFVKSFNNIQYGEVLSKNVPTDWLGERQANDINMSDWKLWPEGELIEIIC